MTTHGGDGHRFRTALAVAAAIHVVVGVAVRALHVTAPSVLPHERLTFFDLSLTREATEEAPPDAPRPETAVATPNPAVPARARSADTRAVAMETPSGATDAPPAPNASAEPSLPDRPLSWDAIGLGGENPFLPRGPGVTNPAKAPPHSDGAADPGAERRRIAAAGERLERSLVTGLLDHDRAAGASRAGPVVTALEETARLVPSPVNGNAEFVATVDATGAVIGLRAARASPSSPDWTRIAALALKKLQNRRLVVPSGTRGLEVRLALSSRSVHPSGARSATWHETPLLNADGTKLNRLDLPPESRALPDSRGPDALNAPFLQQPVPAGGIDGDLADIGSATRRVVHVTIESERAL